MAARKQLARKKTAKDTKENPSFQQIVQKARDRRQKQASTDAFFNKVRTETKPTTEKQNAKRPSSRGIRKPQPARTTVTTRRATREVHLLSSSAPAADLNIRGRALGPTTVLGSNFAPGTTAEDIQTAFEPVGGQLIECRLVSTYPAVMAEMVFADRRGADDVVAKFNNQKADGRILHIRIKPQLA